jgi:hypothetical protein
MKKREKIINNKNTKIMKTRHFFRVALIAILSLSYYAGTKAQTTHATALPLTTAQTVNINSTYHYGVDSTERGAGLSNIYTWTITPGAAGTDYIISPGTNSSSKKIQWLIANTYTITLHEANPAGFGSCTDLPDPTLSVTVSGVATGTVGFTAALGTPQCSVPAATYSPALTTTGTVSYPITVNVTYTINGATTTAAIPVTLSGDPLVIPALVAFTTTTVDDTNRKVTITSITDSFGGNIGLGANTTHTLKIWALPVTSTIHHD